MWQALRRAFLLACYGCKTLESCAIVSRTPDMMKQPPHWKSTDRGHITADHTKLDRSTDHMAPDQITHPASCTESPVAVRSRRLMKDLDTGDAEPLCTGSGEHPPLPLPCALLPPPWALPKPWVLLLVRRPLRRTLRDRRGGSMSGVVVRVERGGLGPALWGCLLAGVFKT